MDDFDATLAALASAGTELKGLEVQHEELKAEEARIQAKLATVEKNKAEKKAQIGVLVTKLQLPQSKPVAKPKSLKEIQAEQTNAKPIEPTEPIEPTPVAKPEPMQKPKSLKEIQAEQAKAKQTKAKPIEPTPQTNPDQTLPLVRFHKCNPCDVAGCAAPWTHETYLHNVRVKEACKKCDKFGSWKKRTDHLHEWCTTAALQQCALCVKRGYDNVRWTQEECHLHMFNL